MKKDQFLQEFLDPILTFKYPPGVAAKMTSPIWYCFVFWLLRQYLSTNGVEGEITPLFMLAYHFNNAAWLWMYIRSRQNAEFAFRALGLQLHIAITELLKGHSYVR